MFGRGRVLLRFYGPDARGVSAAAVLSAMFGLTIAETRLVWDTPLGRWARGLSERAHKNVVVVALATKLARIVWAVLRKERDFDRR